MADVALMEVIVLFSSSVSAFKESPALLDTMILMGARLEPSLGVLRVTVEDWAWRVSPAMLDGAVSAELVATLDKKRLETTFLNPLAANACAC